MKNENKRTKAEWLDIVERYFDATTTPEEEKALRAFLATDESNTADFDEIKVVMGYLSTAKTIESGKYHKKRTYTTSSAEHSASPRSSLSASRHTSQR